MTTIYVYRVSRRVASFTRADARDAWREAIRHIRFLDAYGFRSGSGGRWYQTANRAGYICGSYRATPMIADRA